MYLNIWVFWYFLTLLVVEITKIEWNRIRSIKVSVTLTAILLLQSINMLNVEKLGEFELTVNFTGVCVTCLSLSLTTSLMVFFGFEISHHDTAALRLSTQTVFD